jgi:hypothetical protein
MRLELKNNMWVDIKDSITWGERRRMQSENPYSKKQDEVDPSQIMNWTGRLVASIVTGWSLSVTPTVENIENNLDGDDGDELLNKAMELYGFRSKDSQKKA